MKEGLKKMADRVLLYSLPVSIVGALFKILHFPYANQLLIVGLSSVGLGAFIKYSAEKTAEGYTTGITALLMALAFLFKIMHFQGAQWLIELTIVSALGLGVIRMFFHTEKPEDDK